METRTESIEQRVERVQTREVERLTGNINQFIQSCSHSMRGPLKTIEDLVLLLQHNQFSENDRQAYLKVITTSLQSMERMLDELEHFLENSRREVISQPVDLREMVSDILDEFSRPLLEGRIHASVSIEEHVAFHADASRLQLVLSNVIDNAIRFSDEEKDVRFIDIHANVNNDGALITISDNGIGIAQEVQSRVFEMFFKGSDKSHGVGIGLYIVREVLAKMGGSIAVHSIPREGTKLLISLPNQ